MMSKRYDRIELNNVKRDDNGFLTYDFVAAKTGVFPYWDGNLGKVVMELKHPDDLLTEEVVQQLNKIPITEDHPYELVNLDNAKAFVKGMTHGGSRINNNCLEGNGTVFDAVLIGKILNGNKKECSLGFECELVEESGEYQGVKYDRKQKNFRLNHLAMVKAARCGHECTAKVDAKEDEAVQIRFDEIDQYQNRRSEKTMKIKLDGIEHEVPDVVGTRLQNLETKNDELTKQVGQLEGKLDGKEDEVKQLKQKNEDLEKNQISSEKLDEAIEERLTLVQNATSVLGDEYDFKGKNTREIKVDCIKKVSGEDFKEDGKSDEYINARFDTICDFMNNSEYSSAGENNMKFKGDVATTKTVEEMKNKRLNMKK